MLWLVGFGVICTISGAALFAFGTQHDLRWAIGGPVAAILFMSVFLVLIIPHPMKPKPSLATGNLDANATPASAPKSPNNSSPPDAVLQPADVPAWGQPGPPLDLLSGLNPGTTQLAGSWTMQNGSLISPLGAPAKMFLPVRLPRKYELTAVVERLQGTDSISFGLTIGGRDVTACLDGYQPRTSGLNLIDHSTADRNESRRVGSFIHDDGPTTIVCKVGDNSINVTCSDRVAIDWQGNVNRLQLDHRFSNGPAGFLHISTWDTQFRISRLELRSLP